MTDTSADERDGPVPPTAHRSGAAGWWAAGALIAVVGVILGMAVGHWSVWQAAEPLPTDSQAREIAERFVADQPGTLTRTGDGWSGKPAGWRGFLLGYRSVDDAQISITFPVDSRPAARYAYAESVAERLRDAGWRVHLDPSYPALQAHHAGLVVQYGPKLAAPVEDPSGAVLEQEVLGTTVTIRRDTPASAPLGLALGGLLGGGLAILAVAAAQRRLRSRSAVTRLSALVLSTAGMAGLVPGTLVAIGLLYLFLTETSPQEPLLAAYSLPITRPGALLGTACLLGAVGALLLGPKAEVRSASGTG